MNQDEILHFVLEEQKKRGITQSKFKTNIGTNYGSFWNPLHGYSKSIYLLTVITALDKLGYKLVIEDKEADWGPDMEQLRRMPKKLFHGERIEARDYVHENGFDSRVDLFESPDIVKKFIPTPCDIYELRVASLPRKHFEIMDHPFGKMYSFYSHIPAEKIISKTTHR